MSMLLLVVVWILEIFITAEMVKEKLKRYWKKIEHVDRETPANISISLATCDRRVTPEVQPISESSHASHETIEETTSLVSKY